MDFNNLVFPAPSATYTPFTLDKLIWIPRTRFFSMKNLVKSIDKFENFQNRSGQLSNRESTSKDNHTYIPCHYQSFEESSKNIIIYFHGNAEDIGSASAFTKRVAFGLKADILAVEYPGYGVYEGQASAKAILEDAEIVFDFLTAEVGINPENIIIFGRSIGSGPATHLAAYRNPGALVLMSPYTSIRSVVKDMTGILVSNLVAERFSNIDEIEKAECPCFFIHGKKDKVISWEHSKDLFVKCKAPTAIHLSETMSHNTFKLGHDVVNPIKKFLKQLGFKYGKKKIEFPDYVLKVPLKKYQPKVKTFSSRIADNFVSES